MKLIAPYPRFIRAFAFALMLSLGPIVGLLLSEFSGYPVVWGSVFWFAAFSLIGLTALSFVFPNLVSDGMPAWFLRALSKLSGESTR